MTAKFFFHCHKMEACYSAILKDWAVRSLVDLSIESYAAPRKHLVDNWPTTCKS